jgi:hypothetical protein
MRKANNHYGTCCFRYAATAPRYPLQVLVAQKLLRALRCYRWREKEGKEGNWFSHHDIITEKLSTYSLLKHQPQKCQFSAYRSVTRSYYK